VSKKGAERRAQKCLFYGSRDGSEHRAFSCTFRVSFNCKFIRRRAFMANVHKFICFSSLNARVELFKVIESKFRKTLSSNSQSSIDLELAESIRRYFFVSADALKNSGSFDSARRVEIMYLLRSIFHAVYMPKETNEIFSSSPFPSPGSRLAAAG
jgi:hypothetical protein